ncbi:MAG: hypothetical protein COU22_01010, partial [Candidatus Komeilibacteria bacterium CG10_big_fil_rev_8_21_14_0_10_41_13]
LVVFGGYRWMVAGGNKTKVDAAVKLLYQAAIGFLIIAIAFILSNIIFFGLSNIIRPQKTATTCSDYNLLPEACVQAGCTYDMAFHKCSPI